MLTLYALKKNQVHFNIFLLKSPPRAYTHIYTTTFQRSSGSATMPPRLWAIPTLLLWSIVNTFSLPSSSEPPKSHVIIRLSASLQRTLCVFRMSLIFLGVVFEVFEDLYDLILSSFPVSGAPYLPSSICPNLSLWSILSLPIFWVVKILITGQLPWEDSTPPSLLTVLFA